MNTNSQFNSLSNNSNDNLSKDLNNHQNKRHKTNTSHISDDNALFNNVSVKLTNHLSETLVEPMKHYISNNTNRAIQMAFRVPSKYDESIFAAGDREIHFNAEIDGDTITRFKKLISNVVSDSKDQLVKFNDDGNVPQGRENDPDVMITYIVNSPGGSVHDVLDFVDYINFLRKTYCNIKFTSIITGMVASAGTVMCVIADHRHMTRYAYAMIHELSTGLSRTNYTKIQTHADFIKDVHNDLVSIYQNYRGIDPSDIVSKTDLETLLRNESWMDAYKYKSHGFVEEVIGVYDALNSRKK
jgi:ATP-dependent protease ClpP protease subunit